MCRTLGDRQGWKVPKVLLGLDYPVAMHVADSHGLIRVQGARENNLKNLSVEIPKRRLSVFTGISGSGKSSLVFATIAAESQRLINQTYSAFLQGMMPSQSRPDVDLLEGLTTAIIVDQERMAPMPLHRRHRHRRQRPAAHRVQPARPAAHRHAQGLLVQHPLGPRIGRHDRRAEPARRSSAGRSRSSAACARAARASAPSPTWTSPSCTTTPSRSPRGR